MFPEEIDIIEDFFNENEEVEWNGKTYLYDFKIGDFVYNNGKLIELTGIEALKIWIEKVIRTEKFNFTIYDNSNYGVTIDDLFGSDLDRYLIESELQREITEALIKNPFIEDVEEWDFSFSDSTLTISFHVVNNIENFNFEMVVAQ